MHPHARLNEQKILFYFPCQSTVSTYYRVVVMVQLSFILVFGPSRSALSCESRASKASGTPFSRDRVSPNKIIKETWGKSIVMVNNSSKVSIDYDDEVTTGTRWLSIPVGRIWTCEHSLNGKEFPCAFGIESWTPQPLYKCN